MLLEGENICAYLFSFPCTKSTRIFAAAIDEVIPHLLKPVATYTFGVFGEYREAMFRFIGHLKVNHEVVMLNNRLQDLVIKLDMRYSKDYEKASALDDAIAHNYKFLECETA